MHNLLFEFIDGRGSDVKGILKANRQARSFLVKGGSSRNFFVGRSYSRSFLIRSIYRSQG